MPFGAYFMHRIYLRRVTVSASAKIKPNCPFFLQICSTTVDPTEAPTTYTRLTLNLSKDPCNLGLMNAQAFFQLSRNVNVLKLGT